MTSSDYSKLSRPQKLAALLIVAGPDAAADILRTFPDREVEEICRLMGEFEVVSQELKDFLIVEFEPLIISGFAVNSGTVMSVKTVPDFPVSGSRAPTRSWYRPGGKAVRELRRMPSAFRR